MILGEGHPDTFANMGNLENVLMGQGKIEEAEIIRRVITRLRERMLSEGRLGSPVSLNSHVHMLYSPESIESQRGKRASPRDQTPVLIEESEPEELGDAVVNVAVQQVESCMPQFLQDLRDAVPQAYLDEFPINRIYAFLRDLLSEFAIKIGLNPPTVRHHEVMYIVRENRQ